MSWASPVQILDTEDEEALKAEFVEVWRRFPKHDPFEIAKFVFKDKPDPLRYHAAAHHWGQDIEILERVRIAIIQGGEANAKLSDKEKRLQELREIATDRTTPAKDKIAAYKLIAEMQGEIVKPVDVTSKNKRIGPKQIVIAPYAPAVAA